MCKAFLREKNEFLFRTSLPLPPSLGAWKIKVPPPKGGGVGWLRTASRLVKAQPATVKGIVWFKAAVSLGFVRTEVVCVFNLSFWSTVDLQRCINFCCSVPFSSVTQSCLTLCDPVDCSTPGFPIHHQHPRAYSDSCPLNQWCHPIISSSVIPLSSCLQSFPASGSFQKVSSSHQVAKVLDLLFQHQYFQWIFRVNFL